MRPTPVTRLALSVLASVVVTTGVFVPAAEASPRPQQEEASRAKALSVRFIGMNDLHGNLQPPEMSSGRVTLDDGTTVNAGGAAYLATHVKQLRAAADHSIIVSSGDNIGASPLFSALFHDEPTIEVLNAIKVRASAVGNHEFDEGFAELKRIRRGGCNKADGCQFRKHYRGTDFHYLGANVRRTKDNTRALKPYTIRTVEGIRIGIIGVTLQNLPSVVVPSAVKGLKFGDEVAAINATSKVLARKGVKAQVVLMHQGDETEGGGGPNSCNVEASVGYAIATKASSQVDAIFSGHSHQQYNCTVTDPHGQPRPFIQGLSFGRLLSVVDLLISRRTHDVIRKSTVANNVIVTRDVTPDPKVQAIIDRAVRLSAPIANRPVGKITADLVREAGPSGESPLGDVIADAQLAATTSNGAVIAVTNPGGIRAGLTYASSLAGEGDGVVTYAEAFTVQPFGNIMQTISLTGAQLKAVLEQQWQPQPDGTVTTRVLQISDSLHYAWSRSAPIGSKISNITVAGTPVDPAATYRVSVNNFLAGGGDGFTVFADGTNVVGGPIDLDAFTAYLTAHQPLSPPATNRITVSG